MSLFARTRLPWRSLLVGAAWLAVAVPFGYGQHQYYIPQSPCAPAPLPPGVAPLTPGIPSTGVPREMPREGQQPSQQQQPQQQQQQQAQQPQDSNFSPEASQAGGGETFAAGDTGYIDSAIPRTTLRLRYDSASGNNRPDRAEFFYPKCGCFPGGPGPV